MGEIKTASTVKGESKPNPVVNEKDLDPAEKSNHDNMSQTGANNIVEPENKGGGDGSMPGASPNTFIDSREVEGYVDPAAE